MKTNTQFPIVTVVIPTYNRAELLPRAIDSVLSQTYDSWELIIVDDASEDKTEEVVEKYQDERVRYSRLACRSGVSAARNRGIRESRGLYVAFLDSDDEWLPSKLERQVEVFETSEYNTTLGIVGCRRLDVDAQGEVLRLSQVDYRGNVSKSLLGSWGSYNDIMNSSIAIVKRTVFDHMGMFDENLTDNEDYDMWIRIAQKYTFDAVDAPLARCYKWKTAPRMSREEYFRNKKHFFEKHEDFFKRYPSIYQNKLRWLGVCAHLAGEYPQSRTLFTKAIYFQPFTVNGFKASVQLLASSIGLPVARKV